MSEPLYKTIRACIVELIEKNRGVKNFMLPSENQLAMKYNASRVSVRKALSELEQEGLIYKVRGKGSFPVASAVAATVAPPVSTPPQAEGGLYAFICPDFTTNFPCGIANGIEDRAKRSKADFITLFTHGSTAGEEAAITLAKRLRCNGIIIMPSDEDNYNNAILSLALDKFPTVLVDRVLFGLNLCCVSSNHFEIGYAAADYLAKRHKTVCMISLKDIVSSIQKRIDGFNRGLAANRIHHPHHLIFNGASETEKMIEYFSERPTITGIVCNSGHIFYTLVQAMRALGKTLNTDYEVVTIDNDNADLNASLGLSTASIVQDDYGIGYQAADMLIAHTHDPESPLRNITVPLKLSL